MKARLRVYRQLLRQCQVIVSGKDFEAALVAAQEAQRLLGMIADIEKQKEQPELFNVVAEEREQQAVNFSVQPPEEKP